MYNKTIFSAVGLDKFRYLTTILFFPLMLVLHYKKFDLKFLNNEVLKNPITLGYLLLSVTVIIYGLNIGTTYELDYIKMFVFPGIILFMVGASLLTREDIQKDFIYGLVIFAGLMFVSIIMSGKFDIQSDEERKLMNQLTGIGAIAQGRYSGLLILLSFLLVENKKGIFKGLSIGFLVLAIIWLAMTGTRGPVVAIGISMLVYLFYTGKKTKYLKAVMITIAIAIPALLFFNIEESLLFTRGSRLLEAGGVQSTKRFYRWILFFQLLPDHFMFGLGPGGWGKYVMIGDYRFPHNLIIEALIEFGILGGISISLIGFRSFSITRRLLKNVSSNTYSRLLTIVWIYATVNSMFSGSFLTSSMPFFIVSSLLVGVDISSRKTQKVMKSTIIDQNRMNR